MTGKRFDFQGAVNALLRQLGAQSAESYEWSIETIAGTLLIKANDNWIACRFDDVVAARRQIGSGTLNPYSGKWNWHFDKPDANDVAFFASQLQRIVVGDDAPTAISAGDVVASKCERRHPV